jgi:hypothetical protein
VIAAIRARFGDQATRRSRSAMLEFDIRPPPSGSDGRVAARAFGGAAGRASAVLFLCVREGADRTEDFRLLPALLRSARHSVRFFGGMRERVLERDRFRCRACGTERRLLVHHRTLNNEPQVLVTLCIRCHVRIHRSLGVRYWLSGLLLKLWRELHQDEPLQLLLALDPVTGGQGLPCVFEQAGSAVRAPLSPRQANPLPGIRAARALLEIRVR